VALLAADGKLEKNLSETVAEMDSLKIELRKVCRSPMIVIVVEVHVTAFFATYICFSAT
jgi:hypothetical protein